MALRDFSPISKRPGTALFLRPPLRSYHFLSLVILLVLCLLCVAGVLAKHGGSLSWFARTWIVVGGAASILFWLRATRDLLRIRRVVDVQQIAPGTPLHMALEVAANQLYYGSTYLSLLTAWLTLAIGSVAGGALAGK